MATLVVALTSALSRLAARGRKNHLYVATSEETKRLHSLRGIPEDKIVVRPNFLSEEMTPSWHEGKGVAFIGRLTAEKGIEQLVEEWPSTAPQLSVIGDGPLRQRLETLIDTRENIRLVGHLGNQKARSILRDSKLTIIPSLWAEPFGRTAIESMSVGTPVICTSGGALEEIIGETGFSLDSITSERISTALTEYEEVIDKTSRRKKVHARYRSLYTATQADAGMKDILQMVEKC